MSNLKPCPWCGKVPRYPYWENYNKWRVICTTPKCPVGPSTRGHQRVERAVAAWNRRKDQP